MGLLRFRRSIKLFPGVRLNLGKTGVSTSVGRRGSRVTFGPRGTRATVGLPGSGLSYTATEKWGAHSSATPAPDVMQPATLPGDRAAADLPAAPIEPETPGRGASIFFVLSIIALAIVLMFAF